MSAVAQLPVRQAPKAVVRPDRVDVRLRVQCGCGESYLTIQEGVDHAHKMGHTLTLSGEIRAVKL